MKKGIGGGGGRVWSGGFFSICEGFAGGGKDVGGVGGMRKGTTVLCCAVLCGGFFWG